MWQLMVIKNNTDTRLGMGQELFGVTSVQYKGKLPFQQQKVTERSAFWVKNLWGPQQSHNILEGGGMDIIVVLWFT